MNLLVTKFLVLSFTLITCANPKTVETKKYIFYLHGKIVEDMGLEAANELYGKYEYQGILEALKIDNAQVISEVRKPNTDIKQYAQKIASEIEELIKDGVNPADITVIGASKGALIAMTISTQMKNKNLNFIFVAGSFGPMLDAFEFDLYGNILGFYEKTDKIANFGYQVLIDRSNGVNRYKEVVLNTGRAHGIVFKPLDEWIQPSLEWVKQ